MGNGTSVRHFDCLTAGSKGMSRDNGALLPNGHPPTRVQGTPSGDIKTSSVGVTQISIT